MNTLINYLIKVLPIIIPAGVGTLIGNLLGLPPFITVLICVLSALLGYTMKDQRYKAIIYNIKRLMIYEKAESIRLKVDKIEVDIPQCKDCRLLNNTNLIINLIMDNEGWLPSVYFFGIGKIEVDAIYPPECFSDIIEGMIDTNETKRFKLVCAVNQPMLLNLIKKEDKQDKTIQISVKLNWWIDEKRYLYSGMDQFLYGDDILSPTNDMLLRRVRQNET